MKNYLKLIASILLCYSAGFIGSLYTSDALNSWFQSIEKPSIQPPDWVFAPIWFILYTLMGISFYLILKSGIKDNIKKYALSFFILQLIINACWPIVFFGYKSFSGGFIISGLLVILIGITAYIFYGIKRSAGFLLIPYLLWSAFATLLSYKIWMLNFIFPFLI